jgi:CBS domain-containing protein
MPESAETLAGIFTERDALRWLADGRSLSTSIAEAMTPAPECVGANATVGETIERMASRGFRHLPILDADGHATGIAGVRGIVHYLVEHFPATIYTLPPEPGKSPAEREGA